MNTDEIFVNRRAIAKKICKAIRDNGGQLLNARFFPERPFCDDANSYKFSSANFLRLLASNNDDIIRKCDPRWISSSVIKNNNWSLRQHAQPELLEVWTKSPDGKQLCFLQEFYNAKDILDKDSFTSENQELETIINFFQTRGLLKRRSNVTSFHNCISAVKKSAEDNGADALTSILTVQTWIAETKLKTKLSLFLPTFPDSVLTDIEKNPDKLFTSMNNARAILKKLYHEEIVPIEESLTTDDAFGDLKIIYHGSEVELKSIDGRIYRNESIITSSEAYKFLFALKAKATKESFKTWLEFSYKDYSHGKFLLSDKIPHDEPISAFLRTRLNKNRQQLLHNPQDLKQYIPTGKTIRADDLLQQIKLESTLFLSVMDDFEQEENSYLSNHPELLQIS